MVTSTWQCSFCLEGTKLWCLHVWNCGSGTGLGPGDGQAGRWSLRLMVAPTGSCGSRRCLQAPCACWLLVAFPRSNLWSWFLIWWCWRLFVPRLRFWALQRLFSMFVFQHRAASWEGGVILQYNQSLCVNITSQEVKDGVAEAEPSSLRLLSSLHSLFLLGHEPPHGVAGQVLLLVKLKSKLGSVRNLFWFPSLWAQAINEFVHSVLFFFSAYFLRARMVCFLSGSGANPAPEVIWLMDFPCSLKKWNWHLLENIFPLLKILICAFMLVSFTVLQSNLWTGMRNPSLWWALSLLNSPWTLLWCQGEGCGVLWMHWKGLIFIGYSA